MQEAHTHSVEPGGSETTQLWSSDCDALLVVSALDGDRVVGVDRDNGEGSTFLHLGLVAVRATINNADLVTDLEVTSSAASILAQEAFVNLTFTHVSEGNEVCLERDVEEQISIENNSTG